jgi:hypothetical protein
MPSARTTSRVSAAALLKARSHRWPAIANIGVLIILRRLFLRHFRVPRGQRSESGSRVQRRTSLISRSVRRSPSRRRRARLGRPTAPGEGEPGWRKNRHPHGRDRVPQRPGAQGVIRVVRIRRDEPRDWLVGFGLMLREPGFALSDPFQNRSHGHGLPRHRVLKGPELKSSWNGISHVPPRSGAVRVLSTNT